MARGRVEQDHRAAGGDAARWWVFDRPLRQDPMFLIGFALGLAKVVGTVAERHRYGAGAFVMTLTLSVPLAVVGVGTFGGIFREFIRGRRNRL